MRLKNYLLLLVLESWILEIFSPDATGGELYIVNTFKKIMKMRCHLKITVEPHLRINKQTNKIFMSWQDGSMSKGACHKP